VVLLIPPSVPEKGPPPPIHIPTSPLRPILAPPSPESVGHPLSSSFVFSSTPSRPGPLFPGRLGHSFPFFAGSPSRRAPFEGHPFLCCQVLPLKKASVTSRTLFLLHLSGCSQSHFGFVSPTGMPRWTVPCVECAADPF